MCVGGSMVIEGLEPHALQIQQRPNSKFNFFGCKVPPNAVPRHTKEALNIVTAACPWMLY